MKTPNLPGAPVKTVVMQCAPEAIRSLRALGVDALSPVGNETLPEETREHADMLFCDVGDGDAFVAPGQMGLASFLEEKGFAVRFSSAPGGAYPHDALLNAAVGDGFAVLNPKTADPALLALLNEKGFGFIAVRQGYAKCATCFASENAVITEDGGIASALTGAGFDVLLISPGDVKLSDRHYGFFGGASGLLAPDTLALNGELSFHRDGERIRAFLRNHGVSPLELRSGPIRDIGGILPIE